MPWDKIDVPNSNTTDSWIPKFEWYVGKGGSKNVCQKDTCLGEIGLHAQNNAHHSTLNNNMIRGLVWPLNEHEGPIHFDNAQDIRMNSERYKANGNSHNVDLLIISH